MLQEERTVVGDGRAVGVGLPLEYGGEVGAVALQVGAQYRRLLLELPPVLHRARRRVLVADCKVPMPSYMSSGMRAERTLVGVGGELLGDVRQVLDERRRRWLLGTGDAGCDRARRRAALAHRRQRGRLQLSRQNYYPADDQCHKMNRYCSGRHRWRLTTRSALLRRTRGRALGRRLCGYCNFSYMIVLSKCIERNGGVPVLLGVVSGPG